MEQSLSELPICVSCKIKPASEELLKMPLCDDCHLIFSSTLSHQPSRQLDDKHHLLKNQSSRQGATFKKEVRSPALDKIKSQRKLT